MMRQIAWSIFFVCLLAIPGLAKDCELQPGCTTVITEQSSACSLRGCLQTPLGPASGSATITITGTFSATLVFEQSSDYNTTWTEISGAPIPSGSSSTSTTSTGTWSFDVAAMTNLRVRADVFTSGRAEVTIVYSNAAGGGSGAGAGISDLNGLTVGTQFFTTGTDGDDFNIESDVDTHVFNMPTASCTVRGVIDDVPQVFCGEKTFEGSMVVNNDLYVTGNFSTDHPIEITGEACATSEANVGIFGFDPATGQPCFSYDGSSPSSLVPRLDQVLDPTANKTFDMGGFDLILSNGDIFQIGPDPSSFDSFNNQIVLDASKNRFGVLNPAANLSGIGVVFEQNDETALNARVAAQFSAAATNPSGTMPETRGANFTAYHRATGNSTTLTGVYGEAYAADPAAGMAGNVALIRGGYFYADNFSAGIATTVSGIEIESAFGGGGGMTTVHGLKVNDQTGGTTNYAIKTGLGLSQFQRVSVASGTALEDTDFAIHANWGASGSIAVDRGTDQSFEATVTAAGAGQGLNPTVTLTFKDGTWTTVPVFVCSQNGGTGALSFITAGPTATTLVMTYQGTPVATFTYTISCVGLGI